jgi:hypothetical protein
MDKNRVVKFFKSKFFIFIVQIGVLSILIFSFNYKFEINFDSETLRSHRLILQFLANYILFNSFLSFLFIYLIWLLVSLVPIFIFNNYRKAYSMNLITFFFPNFFFYVFSHRFSRDYFDSYFVEHFLNTIVLGIVIIIFSIGLSFLLKIIKNPRIKTQLEDFNKIVNKTGITCPHCGMKFDSIPKYCYNCNAELSINVENKNEE